MLAHERYVIDALRIHGITDFYSSEPYGEHMSRALGAIDHRVDESRLRVPISGRDVHEDPFAYREYVSPLVYRPCRQCGLSWRSQVLAKPRLLNV